VTTDIAFSWNMPLFRTYARNLCRRKSTKKIRRNVCKSTDEKMKRNYELYGFYDAACNNLSANVFRSYSDTHCVLKSTKYLNDLINKHLNVLNLLIISILFISNFRSIQTHASIQHYGIDTLYGFLKNIPFN